MAEDRITQLVQEVNETTQPAVRVTQVVQEVNEQPPPVTMRVTQVVQEVVMGTTTLVLACPVDNTLTLGVAYTGTMIFSGGSAPYTFTILS